MKILVIDDQQPVLRTTAYALRTMGHEAFTAENSPPAWRVFEEEPIDVLVGCRPSQPNPPAVGPLGRPIVGGG